MRRLFIISIVLFATFTASAHSKTFCIAKDGKTTTIVVDIDDWKGVIRAARDLGDDVRKVTNVSAQVNLQAANSVGLLPHERKNLKASILVGTIGKSRIIDALVKQRKLDVSKVRGQWESYVIDVVDNNLVVAGSDKRGTIYGIYTISERMGVSPWYWWADVPVKHQDEVYWTDGRLVQPSPKVKYRGIFINDEWPSFGGWCTNQFGGVNSKAYAHLFELLLRLKANYFWPAMWATAFNEDDPESPRLADEIIMLFLQNQPTVPAKRSRQEALFQDFIVALVNSYVKHRDVAWYADSASLSVRHFSFMIRRHSGRTPMEWITLVTLTHAKRLLSQPGVQVKEVADLLGFPEQFTFRKYFKQHAGLSPREFQKRGSGV